MVSFSRRSQMLLASTAALFLASCGADDVASPGAGNIDVIVNPPAPAPTPAPSPTGTPTPTPTPTALTAAQFALATTVGSASGSVVTADEQLALVNKGQNNNVNGFGSTLNGVYPTGGTSLAIASNAQTTLGNTGFIQNTSFVGALSGPNDTAFSGWTCNSTAATFLNSSSCAAVPSIGSGGSTATCPTGTTDAGLVQGFRACRLPTTITADLTLPKIAGVFYRFSGETKVGADNGVTGGTGVTLTIQPGVTLVADGSDSAVDVLIVNRGNKINAVGTADAPIIFTSQQNLKADGVSDVTQGQWGGIILLGRATTAVCATGFTNPCQQQIEGVSGYYYGGANDADSSGAMQYVQIRFTGFEVTPGNELQGLTLGGTGSGTTIDHVQSHNSSDDGIEIFGGTTNLRYFVVTGADDDGFDVDNGWRGFMQFIIAAQKVSGATADSFATEIDSNGAEDLIPRTYGRYANFTFVQQAGTNPAPSAIRLRGGADFAFVNGIVKSPTTCVNIVASEGTGADRTTIRAADQAKQDAGPPTFNSVYFQCQGR